MFNKRNIKKITAFLVLILSILPSISAYNGWSRSWDLGFGSFSLSEIFENEIIMFALIFIVFFALIFFSLSKSMKENTGAVVAISVVASALISFALSQKTRYYPYLGEAIGNWLFFIAVIIIIILFLKFITGIIGGIGLILSLFGLWYFASSLDPYDIFPNEILVSGFFSFWQFFSGAGFLVLLIIAFIIVILAAYAGNKDINKKIREWLFPPLFKERYTEVRVPK